MHDFRYVKKSEYRPVEDKLEAILNAVNNNLEKRYRFTPTLVGSASYDMITREANGNRGYDFDYFLNLSYSKWIEDNGKTVKDTIRRNLDAIVPRYGYDCGEDSKTVITIKVKDRANNRIVHGADLSIGFMDNQGNKYILKHNKNDGTYSYEISRNLKEMDEMYNFILRLGGEERLREEYLLLKNKDSNYSIPSHSILKQAMDNVINWFNQTS